MKTPLTPAQKREARRITAAVDAAFREHGQLRQFGVMDLGKILRAGEAAGRAGRDIVGAVLAAMDTYEVTK